jgi:hypothetical protein
VLCAQRAEVARQAVDAPLQSRQLSTCGGHCSKCVAINAVR